MSGRTVAVVGGGAAGLMAAGVLAERGVNVVLIEKNDFVGKKLRITGKGRCNITNIADIEDFFANIPTNSKFLYSALYSFTNTDMINLLNSLGLETKVERGGRVFPVSDNAKDVVEALKRYAFAPNVKLIKATAKKILVQDAKAVGVDTDKGKIASDSVIIATGGKSYPLTGSDGSGYKMAADTGHTVITPKPSLVPIVTKEKWVGKVMGLSLKNVELTVCDKKGKKVFSDFGEMLFTHFGVSGPIVLSASAHMKNMQKEEYKITIDLKPALSEEKLDKRILRDFEKNSRKHLINAFDELLPKALIPVIIEMSGIEPHKEVNAVTKAQRASLVALLKGLPLTVKGFRPIEEAIVTSGGVKVGQINPSTMESKIVKGLFFAGEVIDIDAYTGGFNLQLAFSTGHLAGENA